MFKSPSSLKLILASLIVLISILVSGCSSTSASEYAPNPIADRETLSQVSTINALMAGLYDGVITSGQLKGYGDFGIGTFEALDGEMVVLDGQIYQVKNDGVAYPVEDSVMVPFAAVTFLDSDQTEKIASGTNYTELQTALDKLIPANSFGAIKITGNFNYIKTRSVPRQSKPYPVLTEVTAKQSIFEFNNISGTIVGFRCPAYVNGVNVPGYHLHFLTSDLKAGGHLLDVVVDDTAATLDITPQFFMVLPGPDSDFYKLDLSGNHESELEKAEK